MSGVPPPIRPTGSKLHRLVRCAASAVLPWDVDERRDAATAPARDRGTAIHAFLEAVKIVGPAEALARITDPDVARLCRALDLANLPSHLATEVAMAWDWRKRTARLLGQNLGHRNYWALPEPPTADEIPFTADVMGGAPGGLGYIGDYKTGHTRYPRPGEFAQTLIGGVCAAQLLPARELVLELLYLDHTGQCFPVRDRVDAWVLDAFADQLQDRMERLPGLQALHAGGAEIAATAGDHCQHCGAYKRCSTTIGLVRHLPRSLGEVGLTAVTSDVPDTPDRASLVTAENAGRIYLQVERIEAALAAVKEEIHTLAWHHPVDLPDGRVIDRVERSTRAVDPQIAFAVLEARYDHATALGATDFKISLDAIKKAVGAHLDPAATPKQTIEGKHGVFPQVLAEIDRRGGLHTNVSSFVRPHHPKRKRLPPVG